MKKAIRIRTVSQWYLLKQLNCYLGKRKFPKEVMRKIYHILSSKKLGKDGFIALCIGKIQDDYIGIEEILDMYPYRLRLDERMDEIQIITRNGTVKNWYISYAKVCGQKTKIALIYTTKDCC